MFLVKYRSKMEMNQSMEQKIPLRRGRKTSEPGGGEEREGTIVNMTLA